MRHQPVLCEEFCQWMGWSESIETYVDLTVGGGGHLYEVLSRCPPVKRVLALDRDLEALAIAKERLQKFSQIEFYHGSFADLLESSDEGFDRIALDLGVSSFQLDKPERGFSFQKQGPLDMRMDTSQGLSLAEKLKQVSERELADIFYYYGEEPKARRFARQWMSAKKRGPIETTQDLVEALGCRLDSRDRKGRHPLTRVFQALRIWLNEEFTQLDRALAKIPEKLRPSGRVGIITFHSLEDRKVKLGLKGRLRPLHKKVIQAEEKERLENPRSRSAKLRVYEEGEK